MRRVTASVLTVFLLALSTSAATLPELFVKAKEQFKLGNYKEALATIETLDAESAKPGMARASPPSAGPTRRKRCSSRSWPTSPT
jgi:hypothetical protein